MATQLSDWLDRARQEARLSHGELWLRCFELGGMSSTLELEALLYGALRSAGHDHDVIAQVLNERFAELGVTRSVPYASEFPDETGAPR